MERKTVVIAQSDLERQKAVCEHGMKIEKTGDLIDLSKLMGYENYRFPLFFQPSNHVKQLVGLLRPKKHNEQKNARDKKLITGVYTV